MGQAPEVLRWKHTPANPDSKKIKREMPSLDVGEITLGIFCISWGALFDTQSGFSQRFNLLVTYARKWVCLSPESLFSLVYCNTPAYWTHL